MRNLPTVELITTAEAAEILRISVPTIHRWAADGRLSIAAKGAGVRGPLFFEKAAVSELRAHMDEEKQ